MKLLPFVLLAACASGRLSPVETADSEANTDADGDTDGDTERNAPRDTDGDTDVDPPEWCEEALDGELQLIGEHPTAPYWVWHPEGATEDTATILFLPGGNGTEGAGPPTFEMWFDNGLALPEARVVIVVATDQDLTDEWERVPLVADEILSCYGGDPGKVHLAGTSNGGLGAYSAMLDAPERFATLLGCPGVWLQWDEDRIVAALQGKSVFNGVGELDTSWQPYVQRTHEALLDLGIDSVYVEFEGQGHIPGPDFDGSEMYHFWAEHSE